jgi:hypothetical protein
MFKNYKFIILLLTSYPLISNAADNQSPILTPKGELKIHHNVALQVKQSDWPEQHSCFC